MSNIIEKLDELKKLDENTYNRIMSWLNDDRLHLQRYEHIGFWVIQGEIQRAIEKRGWHCDLAGISCEGYDRWQAAIHKSLEELDESDWNESSAEALLDAYLKAMQSVKE